MNIKRAIAAMLVLTLAAGVTACASIKLSDAYDEAAVKERASEIVGLINENDYEAVAAMARADIADKLTADIIGAAVEDEVKNEGAFRELKQIAVGGTQSNGNDYALAVVLCVHENGSMTYAITFDTDMSIAGFFIK